MSQIAVVALSVVFGGMIVYAAVTTYYHRILGAMSQSWADEVTEFDRRSRVDMIDVYEKHALQLQAAHTAHNDQLQNIINHASTTAVGIPQVTEGSNLDANEEDTALLRKSEIAAMVEWIQEKGEVSAERAQEEAEAMLARLGV